jgi:hypothetical protein
LGTLSFIGQTYGAASALLAVLALIGMVATLALQAHDTGIAREEARLRAVSREMFSARPGRAYWRAARGLRLAMPQNKRMHRFHRILDEEYRRAPEPRPSLRAAAAGGAGPSSRLLRPARS